MKLNSKAMGHRRLTRQNLLYSRIFTLALASFIGCGALSAFADEVPKSIDATRLEATSSPLTLPPIKLPVIVDLQRDILRGQSIDPVTTSSIKTPDDSQPASPASTVPAQALTSAPPAEPIAESQKQATLSLPHPLSQVYPQQVQPQPVVEEHAPDNVTPQIATPAEATPAPVQPAQIIPAANERLKQALDAWSAEPVAHVADRKRHEAIVNFYTARNFEPLWTKDGRWSAQAHAALTRIGKADEDGLDLTGAHLPRLGQDFAEAEDILLSDAVTAYAAQAAGGRIDPLEISKFITAKPTPPDFAAVLNEVASAENADAALQATNPPQKAYADLRAKLAELRREAQPMAQKPIPSGPTLKVGMKDERVPLIRERFGLAIEQNPNSAQDIVYDTRVAAAVANFQTTNGLPASGSLTPRTIALLSDGQPARLENEIISNMEVWRWLPRELGHDRIEVSLPEFTVRLYRNDVVVHQTRVVIGKPATPTPVFSNKVQFLIVNPYWNVPLSIIKKEMMPKAAIDPDYYARHGYELVKRGGITYVRQPPGDANALGRIKFMFPNEHSVYLHDTPSKSLFAQKRRAFSHGCVRVDQPFSLAEAVLGAGWTEQRIHSLIGSQERTINLPEPLPIHIMYFTTSVDDTGKLQIYDDIYGYMRKIETLLRLES